MKAYVVGGSVRDELLGRASGDRDWVVVGATPAELTDLIGAADRGLYRAKAAGRNQVAVADGSAASSEAADSKSTVVVPIRARSAA